MRLGLGSPEQVGDEELPLKFEEIVDVKTYDKMRPPKPGGLIPRISLNNIIRQFNIYHLLLMRLDKIVSS